jgi:hypothetical protein
MNKSTKTEGIGKKTIAVLLMIALFSVLIPTRGAEVARSNDQLRACQENASTVATAGHPFVLEISTAVIYLTHPEEKFWLQSPAILIHPHRGPPVLS